MSWQTDWWQFSSGSYCTSKARDWVESDQHYRVYVTKYAYENEFDLDIQLQETVVLQVSHSEDWAMLETLELAGPVVVLMAEKL